MCPPNPVCRHPDPDRMRRTYNQLGGDTHGVCHLANAVVLPRPRPSVFLTRHPPAVVVTAARRICLSCVQLGSRCEQLGSRPSGLMRRCAHLNRLRARCTMQSTVCTCHHSAQRLPEPVAPALTLSAVSSCHCSGAYAAIGCPTPQPQTVHFHRQRIVGRFAPV